MDFSYNVPKTLVECNESKFNNIETMMIIGENVDDVKIISEENRLKQIILNLVSYPFKFTKSGFIKILAKFNPELNFVEIRVEYSGMGIKEDDHHLIFQENSQLNVDQENRSKGSGLGLSITKNLSHALNHKIAFE